MSNPLKDGSPLRRFVQAWRDFGFVVASRVAFSKIRGGLCPSLALAEPPSYDGPPRQLTILLDAAAQDAAALQAAVDVLTERGGSDWEICICDRQSGEPEVGLTLERLRGTAPWIRVVSADRSIDAATASRWTVEQSTGEFVAFLAPGYRLAAAAIDALLSQLRQNSGIEAASLLAPEELSGGQQGGERLLVLQRKSQYLAACSGSWPLRAPDLARALAEKGVPTALLHATANTGGGRNIREAL